MPETSTVQDLRSRDLQELHTAVAHAYFPHELEALKSQVSPGVVRTLGLGPLTLGRIRWGRDIALDCDYAQDAYEVNVVLEGALTWERDGQRWTAGPGQAAVFVPGRHSTITHWGADATVLGIKVQREMIHRYLAADVALPAPLEDMSPGMLDLRSSEGRSWVGFIRSSAEHIISDPAAVALPAFRESLVASVAAPMAAFLVPDAGAAPPGPYMIRRVRDAVERDLGRRWSLDDMAAVSGVGRRRLQQAFRDYVGTTPTAWLMRLRLDQAYKQLITSEGEEAIHVVAYACGFNHLGRFSQDFQARFGCRPSEVARRAREE